MLNLPNRLRQHEWMDQGDVDPAALDHSLRFIRRINSLLGYSRATLSHLRRFSRAWAPGQRIALLDIATGSADIPLALARWAAHRGLDLQIVGLDRHPITANFAQRAIRTVSRNSHRPPIQLIRADALSLPFADNSFDYVMTNMFLHHLDDADVVRVLREMDRVARCGIIVADLLRHRRALAWITLFTCLASPMLRHDATVSVQQSFTLPEILALRDRAGVDYARSFRHFGHRFVLAGEKPSIPAKNVGDLQSGSGILD